jgi:hypothetical protein
MRSQASQQRSDPPFAPDGKSDAASVICRETVHHSVKNGSEGLRAIILTGSMARSEETYIHQNNGVRVMGDAEFVLVFRDRISVPAAEKMARTRGRIEKSLVAQGIFCAVGLSAVPPSFLAEAQPHVFAYELRTCGKVIWGEPKVLELMPAFQPSDIPLEDAWRLLQNRMVEMLQFPDTFEGCRAALPAETHYRTVKLYLDMATSFLLFAGAYAPTYRERVERLRELAQGKGKEDWPFPLEGFVQAVAACTAWKLGGESAPASRDGNFWLDAVACARRLWRWELARLTGAGNDATDQDLFSGWMQKRTHSERLRGWLFAMRQQGWLHSWRQWPRWARRAWQASPRYWIYLAASELLFGLAGALEPGTAEGDSQLSRVLDYLPLRRDGRGEPAWREIAEEIAFNYSQLLVETRV